MVYTRRQATLKRAREEARVKEVEESLALGMHLYGRTHMDDEEITRERAMKNENLCAELIEELYHVIVASGHLKTAFREQDVDEILETTITLNKSEASLKEHLLNLNKQLAIDIPIETFPRFLLTEIYSDLRTTARLDDDGNIEGDINATINNIVNQYITCRIAVPTFFGGKKINRRNRTNRRNRRNRTNRKKHRRTYKTRKM
jgi:hypothetical protein